MFRCFVILFFLVLTTNTNASNKEKIINNLKDTNNINFDFEQNINGKIESGNCIIEYPKKIWCEYNKNNISGMIDFYYSCKGFLIYDLAVVVNDWCSDGNGRIINDSLVSLLSAYNNQRVIQDNEKKYWRHALISASLRFYLSRLIDLHYPKIGEMTHIKDPNIFENILIDRIKKPHEIKV